MKKLPKKLLIISASLIVFFIAVILIINFYVMPNYVYAPELEVPDIIGMNQDDAVELLKELSLNPVIDGMRYDAKFEKDEIIFQRPRAGTSVKENRRIYMIVSGGDPKISMPSLIGKTYRDAKITVERLGLILDQVDRIRSEFPAETIVEQLEIAGQQMEAGDTVHLSVSVGPRVGKSRVPNLIGESLQGAENILKRVSLKIGRVEYIPSRTLLPNTISEQYPSKGTLLEYGDSVDVYVYKSIK
ncbi:MAG: PASTA domain-containing protein [Ignavibacteriae bacterium]|nr:PASTA domain-containing protein [Ignavibacteriota bacterium]NOG96545.1 PASTA domain-containing protein [Ignavibacteriota bacterium]